MINETPNRNESLIYCSSINDDNTTFSRFFSIEASRQRDLIGGGSPSLSLGPMSNSFDVQVPASTTLPEIETVEHTHTTPCIYCNRYLQRHIYLPYRCDRKKKLPPAPPQSQKLKVGAALRDFSASGLLLF